ncbi:uncharacterized protein BYT42DRAFT_646592 [Radiomyces spectabilis]|uniref:uncharacterized protein n=1 Tax=Radiomyces spectabilis TaxID=64574 RepID=UPI00221FBF2F|nr:uncharacterized protein BYT42DRAFT_646592 [Radiomyces spectabilis]KAI8374655.1 hypothetical protein BYT42DRAFT_646592 [Radiomyces spectabilis]
MLAGLLNRTLIVPPARLGRGIGWKPKGQLFSRLEWLRALKDFANRCQPPTPSKPATYLLGTKCEEYRHFATIRWSELHNIATLDNDVRFRFVDFVSPTKLQDMLRIDAAETYTHTDERLYDWYYTSVLQGKPFEFVKSEHLALQQRIAGTLRYRLDTPLGETVKGIVDYLGGTGSFMAVHFRNADQPFRKMLPSNMEMFLENMIMAHAFLQYSSIQLEDRMPQHTEQSIRVSKTGSRTMVYVATDHRDPQREMSPLLPWFEQFPCSVILDDLPPYSRL